VSKVRTLGAVTCAFPSRLVSKKICPRRRHWQEYEVMWLRPKTGRSDHQLAKAEDQTPPRVRTPVWGRCE
jgi:hypothetical protein